MANSIHFFTVAGNLNVFNTPQPNGILSDLSENFTIVVLIGEHCHKDVCVKNKVF